MKFISWLGLTVCAVAALGYLGQGNYNMAGLMIALAVVSLINIRRKHGRNDRPPSP
ncbi:hypothetical protein [Stutzerimonas azotifigens]|uniref:Lipoprotein n=1 Tax=Stutzerimonas azotifigens TaxID=291995 RepID=A0ABR5YZF3_9GAMM|nr:hypothetical protein [Stutzerimonas azotifigens]MBA1273328.1 hypothetical protein [Stutzerimonas azotifigens]